MESRKRKNPVEKEDGTWSWVIAFSCCFINCLLYGVARLSGLLMVATLETFDVNRASASLPFSVSTSVRNLSGIFVGYLGQRFGLRNTIAIGCTLASLGAGMCFFVSDIRWMVVCWGGIFGTGFGLATCLLPLAINQHFIQYRGIASGISYSGSYIGSFVFPPLVVILLDKYGLSGTFIVICATFLNGLAVAMLFRKHSKPIDALKLVNVQKLHYYNEDQTTEYPETENRLKRIWHRLLRKIKSKNRFFKGKELESPTALSPVFFITSESYKGQMYHKTKIESDSCQLLSYKDLSFNQINFPSSSDEVPLIAQQRNSSLFPNLLQNKISKVKFKAKINKTKNSFSSLIIRRGYSLDKQFSYFPLENVKLISFRNRKYSCHTEKIFFKKLPEINALCCALKNKRSLSPLTSSARKYTCEIDYSGKSLTKKEENSKIKDFIPSRVVDDCFEQQQFNVLFDAPKSISSCDIIKDKINDNHRKSLLTLVPYLSTASSTASFPPFDHKQEISNFDSNSKETRCSVFRGACKCLFGWFRLYGDLMFLVIAVTMSLHTFVIVCMITIIEDFAKDIGVSECQVHYVLMVLSIADLIGSLTLGLITDRRVLSRCNFIILCFLGMAISQISISYTRSFKTLLSLVAINGIFESGIIITFPLLIAHFIPPKKQAVAVASSNILSSPTVLLVPLVIGYFRDGNGCYSGAFYSLGMTSLFCCFIWFISTCTFARHKSKTDIPLSIAKQCK